MKKLYAVERNGKYLIGKGELLDTAKHLDIQNTILIKALLGYQLDKEPDNLVRLSESIEVLFDSASQAETHLKSIQDEVNHVLSKLGLGLIDVKGFFEEFAIVDVEEANPTDIEHLEISGGDWLVCAHYENEGFSLYRENALFGLSQVEWLEEAEIEKAWSTTDQFEAITKAKHISRQTGIYAFPYQKRTLTN
ncbi:hypothetical protein [Vibrio harveyi]|uniref:hypothetical protein n=1 Tax=Vibrio harveyi TaxID=669 RepID=UPI003CEC10A1